MGLVAICANLPAPSPEYPKTYRAVQEDVRFIDEVIQVSSDVKKNKLCMTNDLNGRSCMHIKKFNEANQAMDNAVKENKEGVIWQGANGNGEVWTIERNNYRFIITAQKDENYK